MPIDYSNPAAVAAALSQLDTLAAADPEYGVQRTGDKIHVIVYQKTIGSVYDKTKKPRSEAGLTSFRFQLDQAIDFFNRTAPPAPPPPPPPPVTHSYYGVAIYGSSYYG